MSVDALFKFRLKESRRTESLFKSNAPTVSFDKQAKMRVSRLSKQFYLLSKAS